MKFPVYLCLTLVLFLTFSADLTAQTGFSVIKYNSTLNHFNDKNTNVSRPRVFVEKAEAKPKASAPFTVFDLEKQTFDLINEKRREQGLKPLEWNESIAKIARLHSRDMANNKFFSHAGNDGSN
ncbi:MAG TPA: CAP domain-containing protein, partial [Pyrinomonadaceae bacterium]